MTGIVTTKHAIMRLAQRALKASDLEWAFQLGREVDDGLLVLDKDTKATARDLERQAQRIRRLGSLRIIYDSDKLITVYRTHPAKQKRLLHRIECRILGD
jgi:hypothetical protein